MKTSEFSRHWQIRWRRRVGRTSLKHRHSLDQRDVAFAPLEDVDLMKLQKSANTAMQRPVI